MRPTPSRFAVSRRLRLARVLRHSTVVGGRATITGHPRFDLRGRVLIGSGLVVCADVERVEIVVADGAELALGTDVFIDQGVSIGVTRSIAIGDRCRIGPHVQILDNSFHHVGLERRDEVPASSAVVIGDDVAIGAMSLVLPGAHIGSNVTVAPRSVVVGVVPDRSVVSGIPATVVASR